MNTPETPLQALDWLVGSSMHPHVVEIHQRAEIVRKALSREPVSAAAPEPFDWSNDPEVVAAQQTYIDASNERDEAYEDQNVLAAAGAQEAMSEAWQAMFDVVVKRAALRSSSPEAGATPEPPEEDS